jgi:hypothetical protein
MIRKSTKAKDAKKCMVLADCAPKNIFNRKGYAAVMAGDIVMPVMATNGKRKNITFR